MSDDIAVLHDGKIEQYDSPEMIYGKPATEFVARFVGKSNWLNGTELFRPEAAVTSEKDGFPCYRLPVRSVQYLGDSYEIILEYQNVTWTIHSSQKAVPGEVLSVYIDPEKIIQCKKE